MMHSRLAVVSFAALALAGIAIAAETTIVTPERLRKIVEVRDVRVQPDEVSGVLVNLSSLPVRNVQVRIDRSWLWKNERYPGPDEDNPGRSVVHAVAGEIPPGGRLPFTYRSASALPQRSDGSFYTSVSVVGLEQVGSGRGLTSPGETRRGRPACLEPGPRVQAHPPAAAAIRPA
jgi:hypothetical protein